MKYWLIVGIKDRKFEASIAEMIRSFEVPPEAAVGVLVVETGEAVGCWKPDESAVVRVQNIRGVVAFLNTALLWLKENAGPDDWFVRIDSDDYYGPKYLLEVDASRRAGAVCSGIASCFVRTEDDHLYFCKGLNPARAGVPGGTLAGNIEVAEFFRSEQAWGEDSNWCQDMDEIGWTVMGRHHAHYAMCRWSGHIHTFPVRGHELPHVWLCNAQDMGSWDESVVLEGKTEGTPVEPSPELALAHFHRTLV